MKKSSYYVIRRTNKTLSAYAKKRIKGGRGNKVRVQLDPLNEINFGDVRGWEYACEFGEPITFTKKREAQKFLLVVYASAPDYYYQIHMVEGVLQ
jgi:hypothetical protein